MCSLDRRARQSGVGKFEWSLHGSGSVQRRGALVAEAAAALAVDEAAEHGVAGVATGHGDADRVPGDPLGEPQRRGAVVRPDDPVALPVSELAPVIDGVRTAGDVGQSWPRRLGSGLTTTSVGGDGGSAGTRSASPRTRRRRPPGRWSLCTHGHGPPRPPGRPRWHTGSGQASARRSPGPKAGRVTPSGAGVDGNAPCPPDVQPPQAGSALARRWWSPPA